jgi:endonuclease/exonuclease/phosphatase family metal-dependent hydrolase
MRRDRALRVLTWNVHGCVGSDRICDPARVAAAIEEIDPDIAALQEIDAGAAHALAIDPFEYFAERFGWQKITARTLLRTHGHYGHVLLSRWPIESLGDEDLSIQGSEPRTALLASILAPFGSLVVVAAHLGLRGRDRRRQLDRIRRRLSTLPTSAVLVLGDFNDFRPNAPADQRFCPPLHRAPLRRTFPSCAPLMPLDRIWYGSAFSLAAISAPRSARRLSDHLPLVADLEFEPRLLEREASEFQFSDAAHDGHDNQLVQ